LEQAAVRHLGRTAAAVMIVPPPTHHAGLEV
jgi:hypothetical protein